jgi:hypothetical protein
MTVQTKSVKAYYKRDPSNPCHALKMEGRNSSPRQFLILSYAVGERTMNTVSDRRRAGVIACPLFNLVALINEVDLYPKWVPFLKAGIFIERYVIVGETERERERERV